MIGRRLQNYKVLSLLGQGGMGAVYKVFDIRLERFAALKILSLNTTHNSTFIERFKREARNQAKLMHPNIVSVYGFVEEKDVLGIAMEYKYYSRKGENRIQLCFRTDITDIKWN